ncbi:hypothetical protein ZIOFF_068615 [Zingiber officinale]|uniref:BRCT domain-containing protein n=1 Tax=Zingiber officinale TaxID=94328 RepID=A0A8J5ERZ7_ZINOF|nr:hypothetical protein ZIOFF_068615 [Zingiber officinale]
MRQQRLPSPVRCARLRFKSGGAHFPISNTAARPPPPPPPPPLPTPPYPSEWRHQDLRYLRGQRPDPIPHGPGTLENSVVAVLRNPLSHTPEGTRLSFQVRHLFLVLARSSSFQLSFHRSYMAVKSQKLREQFDASAVFRGRLGSGKGIFFGISIFVDGFTIPSSQDLRACMMTHGGRYENYFSRRSVTHIICSHLPDSKMRNFRAFSRGLPVVKPAWVIESVAANKLLSWVPYQLNELENGTHKQQKLSSFFTSKSVSNRRDEKTTIALSSLSTRRLLLLKNEKMNQLIVDEQGECSTYREAMFNGTEKFCEVEYEAPSINDMKEKHKGIEMGQSFACVNEVKLKEQLDNPYNGPCNQQQEGANEDNFQQIQTCTTSYSRPDDLHPDAHDDNHLDMIPQSLSQLDYSVLDQLPKELKADILASLPPHRIHHYPGNDPSTSEKDMPSNPDENPGNSNMSMWMGTPPSWVEKFQHSNCFVLNIMATQFARSDTNGLLSLTLQSLSPFLPSFSDLSSMESEEMICSLVELFKQYIKLKIESDIEELYVCSRILRRFATDFKFLFQVYDLILPTLQASISEYYGGNFSLPFDK